MNRGNRVVSGQDRIEFGLIAWLEKTRIKLPLKGVDCRFQVCGDLVSVEIDQIFQQNNNRSLDCLYSFPLPGGAAVYRCEMHVNDRLVRAVVEEQEKARELAWEKKAQGYRTALVEMDRENLFTLSLGNLQPGDLVIVRLAYFQTLTRLADWTSFQIPFCPGLRYIPGRPLLRSPSGRGVVDDTDEVPDASRISPPRIDAFHPDAALLSVEGRVANPQGQVADLSSPSHPVVVRDGEGALTISLADQGAVPDRDLVIRWTEAPGEPWNGLGWVTRKEKESYALVRLQAPRAESGVSEVGKVGKDVYFLLDQSGSMEGLKWIRTVQAFREFIKTLHPKDRVWATLFESGYQDFAEKPLPAEAVLADERVQKLEELGVRGGTDLLPALIHVLGKLREHSAGGMGTLVIITDGQVGNEKEILRRLQEFPEVRVHTFGIDTAVNDAFLKRIAEQQKGTCHLMTPKDDLVGTVVRLGPRLQTPVWVQIKPEAPWRLATDQTADLHANETHYLALQGPEAAGPVRLTGKRSDGSITTLTCDLQEQAMPALRLFWNKQRIDFLLAQGERAKAVALAKASNLVCEGASFVAWDEAEKVAVASQEIYQPVMGMGHFGTVAYCCSGYASSEPSHYRMFRSVPRRPRATVLDSLFDRMKDLRKAAAPIEHSAETQAFVRNLQKREPGTNLSFIPTGILDLMANRYRTIQQEPDKDWPITVALFEILVLWAGSEAGWIEERWRSIEGLLGVLRTAPQDRTHRKKMFQEWIKNNLHYRKDYRDQVIAQLESAKPGV